MTSALRSRKLPESLNMQPLKVYSVIEPFLKRPLKEIKEAPKKEMELVGPLIEQDASRAVVSFEKANLYVAVESMVDGGFELQLFSREHKPLTPRLSCSRLEQILYDRKFTPIRAVIKDTEDRSQLVSSLQQIASSLLPAKDERRERKKEGAKQREADSIAVETEDFFMIHPAGDYSGDGCFTFEYTTMPEKGFPTHRLNVLVWFNAEKGERGFVAFEDKTPSVTIEDKTFYLLKEIDVETGVENLLSLDGLKKWLDKSYQPDPYEAWSRVLAFCKRFVYFVDPSSYYVLTAWIIATYFYYGFPAFPYINPIGEAEAGKTTTLRIARQLAYHSSAITIPREASVFRSVDAYQCTLLNDEGDAIINYNQGVQDVFNSGFQKGARVPREFPLGDGRFKTKYFNVYSPKMITSKYPLPEMADSRSIKLFMRGQPPRGIDYGQYEDELVDLKTGEALRDDLYILRLLLCNKVMEEYRKINLYREYRSKNIRGREAGLFKPLIAVIRVFCPTTHEEQQIINAAVQHGELSRVRKHATRQAKAVKAILAVLRKDYPSTFEGLQRTCRDVIAGKPKEEELTQEIVLSNKEIHSKYTELFQKELTVTDKAYLSAEGMSRLLQQTMGYRGEKKRGLRNINIAYGRSIHDILTYELYEDIDIEEPEEPQEPEKKGLEQYAG